MTMTSAESEDLFNQIVQFISDSRALLDSGSLMELAGLDDQVRVLCEALLQLPQEERISYSGRLQQLLGDLKALAEEMVEQRDKLAEEIRGLPHHKKANVAYKTIDSSVAYPDDENE